jgi:uncharacterized protein
MKYSTASKKVDYRGKGMKKKWLFIVALGLVGILAIPSLTGCAGPATAQVAASQVVVSQQATGFWVNGKGEITVTPNLATLSVGVETMEANVADAQAEASDGIKKIMKSLTDSGINLKDIQTGYYYITQRLNYSSYKSDIIGYTVTNMLTVKIRDVDKTGDIINSAVATAGDIVRISNLSFSVEDPSEVYQQAREKATANAHDKAAQYAGLLGVKLGSPTYVSESTQQSNPYYYGNNVSNYYSGNIPVPVVSDSSDSTISPGQNKLSLSITVAYELIR